MFTAKDLEVYKDALKEKKNKAAKIGEKPLKTPPSVAKISKPPLKLQNEEPIKERKPLSVVHKATNTIKEPHKLPSTPVGSSKQTNPGLKIKEITPNSPSLGLPAEANSLIKASNRKNEPLRSPSETSLLKPPHIKPDDNKIASLRKPKESTIPGASTGVHQKSPSLMSGMKVAPATNVNASLCSECTRAASEGAVCFIGNDGRVSACTTRSAVRLCKNLNCAANNPEYVAAMANAPKKYLISKRHSLKAQFGFKNKSDLPKSPNLRQTDATTMHGRHHSSDALSPSKGDVSPLNGANIDTSLNSFALESEDGGLSPVNGNLSLFDVDTSLLEGSDVFCDGEMGLMNDVRRGTACAQDYAAAEQGIAEHRDVINEQEEFSFHEGEAGEIQSAKFSRLELSKWHTEVLAESDGRDDANPRTDAEDDEYARGSPSFRANDTDISLMKDYEDMLPNGNGEQVNGEAQSVDMALMSLAEDGNQNENVISTTDFSQLSGDDQTGDKLNNQGRDDENIGDVTSKVYVNYAKDDNISIIDINQPVHNNHKGGDLTPIDVSEVGDDDKGGDLTPIGVSEVGDDGDSMTTFDTHVARQNQSDSTENNDDGHNGHVDIPMLDGACGGDNILSVNDALSVIITLPNGGHIMDDHQGDVNISWNDRHGADDNQCLQPTSPHGMLKVDGNVISSPHEIQVADEGDNVPSLHGNHVTDNEESNETAFRHDKQVLEDCLIHGSMCSNGKHAADDDKSTEDDDEDGETDDIVKNVCLADNNSSINFQDTTKKGTGGGGEDGTVTSSNVKKGSKQRRRVLNGVEESNPEKVTLRKQQTQERKQAEEWMLNYAIEGVVHKLAPTGEAKVKILVEAFESIISHTDVEGIDSHNASKEKQT